MKYRNGVLTLTAAGVALLAAGCASSHSTTGASPAALAPTTQPVKTPTYATPTSNPAPDIEMTVCTDFDRLVLPGIAATLHNAIGTGTPNPPYSPAEAKLLRDDSKLSRWSYLVESQADDAAFANYLGNAGTALGIVGAPYSTSSQAETAAQDVGDVNGYCKYDAS